MFRMPWNEKRKLQISSKATCGDILINVVSYVSILAILMKINAIYLYIPEPNFGKPDWTIGWICFALCYSIPLLFIIIFMIIMNFDWKTCYRICFSYMCITILLVELYHIFDLESLNLGITVILSAGCLMIIYITLIFFLKFNLNSILNKLLFLCVVLITTVVAYCYFIFDANQELSQWNAPSYSPDQYVIAVKYGKGACFNTYYDIRRLKGQDLSTEISCTYLSQAWRGTGFKRIYYKYPRGIDIKMIEEMIRNRFQQNVKINKLSKECKVAVIDHTGYFTMIH